MLPLNRSTEWPKCQLCDLEELHAERYADDCDAEDQAHQGIPQRQYCAADNEP